jgi:hypothetical protein
METVNKLFDLAKSVQEWRKGKKKANLKLFFEEHVNPVFHQMERIHRDYVDGIGGLLQKMRTGELPPRELYEWLEQKRRELESERIDARNFDEELNLSSFYQSTMGSEIGGALSDFVKAVTDYFLTPDSLYKLSFYSDFSIQLKMMVQSTEAVQKRMSKEFYDTKFVKDFYGSLERTLNTHLPKKWDQVSVSYRRAKGLLLS